jgi:hypothetical protein
MLLLRSVALSCALLVIGCDRGPDQEPASAPAGEAPVIAPVKDAAIKERDTRRAPPAARRDRIRSHPKLSVEVAKPCCEAAPREPLLFSDEAPLTAGELHAQRADTWIASELRRQPPFVLAEAVHWAEQNRVSVGNGSGRP